MNKAFGDFIIKEFDAEKRKFVGIATTPKQDYAKDVVSPSGAKFKLPMPLLLHHDKKSPVGQVTSAKVLPSGIEVEFELPDVEESGNLKDRVDEAMQSLKYGLIKGLSIGFLPNWDNAKLLPGGGVEFNDWDWYELSLVTIPCNSDCSVTHAKEFKEYQAAMSQNTQNTTAQKAVRVVKLPKVAE